MDSRFRGNDVIRVRYVTLATTVIPAEAGIHNVRRIPKLELEVKRTSAPESRARCARRWKTSRSIAWTWFMPGARPSPSGSGSVRWPRAACRTTSDGPRSGEWATVAHAGKYAMIAAKTRGCGDDVHPNEETAGRPDRTLRRPPVRGVGGGRARRKVCRNRREDRRDAAMTSTRTRRRPDARTARSDGPRSGEWAAVVHAGRYAGITAKTGEMRR